VFDIINDRYIIFLLAATRLSGVFIFNPILGRRNIPGILKVGLALIVGIGISQSLDTAVPKIDSLLTFVAIVAKELLVGFGIGLIMNIFMSAFIIAGEQTDLQMGLSMGKIYDPSSNVSMAITSTVYNILFTLIFFASNSHLTLIKLVADSCTTFPLGRDIFNVEAGKYIVLMFGDALTLALKIAIPVIAIEFLAEAGLGVMMRLVQHINIFSIGLQVKLAVGLLVVAITIPLMSNMIDSSMSYIFERIGDGIGRMLSA
jgi:flagellar biosynthetic protein FliR